VVVGVVGLAANAPSASAQSAPAPTWWSLRPLARPEVPALGDAQGRPLPPIDAFVAAKLREHGLNAAPPADRRTLIRRLAFDLLGLPTRDDEFEAFVARSERGTASRSLPNRRATASAGRGTGSTWCATPTRTATTRTSCARTPGRTATT
jgi:hypothetical protein